MDEFTIFTAALNLVKPWYIDYVELKEGPEKEEIHITISHDKGSKFDYEGDSCPVYDHQGRVWRHLDFFQYECYLHVSVPRVKTKQGSIRLIAVPWAEPGSRFTLLFELKIMELVYNGMNQSKAGKTLGISAKRVSRVLNRRVSNALIMQPLEKVKELAIDETSSKKGHNYLTILSDREKKKVVGVSEGKDTKAVENALVDMEVRGAHREDVRTLTIDMSRSYISSAAKFFEQASVIFDRFHIMKKMNEAVDIIRREEQRKSKAAFKKTRYWWLYNSEKLKDFQRERIEQLGAAYPTIGEAYRLKELLRDVFDHAKYDKRLYWLNDWIKQAKKTGLEPILKFVNMLHNHWYGIKTYFKELATNAYAENVNLKIQEIKRTARGFRNPNNFRLLIYFHLGKLDLGIPT